MLERIRLLIIDDHPMITLGYESALKSKMSLHNLILTTVHTIDDCLIQIKEQKNSFDIVFLDINLPPSKNGNIIDGESLGMYLRKKYPKLKIVVLTMLSDAMRINSIAETINPNGFLLKTEATPLLLETTLKKVWDNSFFYSSKVEKIINQKKNGSYLDIFDRKILYYISIGEKMKNMPLQ